MTNEKFLQWRKSLYEILLGLGIIIFDPTIELCWGLGLIIIGGCKENLPMILIGAVTVFCGFGILGNIYIDVWRYAPGKN